MYTKPISCMSNRLESVGTSCIADPKLKAQQTEADRCSFLGSGVNLLNPVKVVSPPFDL